MLADKPEAVMPDEVCPVDHMYELPPPAVNVVDAPLHILKSPVRVTDGSGSMVSLNGFLTLLHPLVTSTASA